MATSERIHFGSLEESQRRSGETAHLVDKKKGGKAAAANDIDFDMLREGDGNGSIDAMEGVREDQAQLEQEFQKRALLRSLAIPTDDLVVRNRLREFYEPMTLFGEGPLERRDRLKEIVAQKTIDGEEIDWDESSSEDEDGQKEEYYTYGSDELKGARRTILDYSIERAKHRLQNHQLEIDTPFADRKKARHEWYTKINGFETKSLQFGDERPIGFCSFSPNSKLLATASWSGLLKTWSVATSENISILRGHRDRVSCLDFHPGATISQSSDSLNIVSGSVDGGVHMWSLKQNTPIGSLEGHAMRVARLAFHPSGRFLGTASFDTTWRLWDVETRQELLLQEGHSREVFTIGFQCDGALAATAGLDSIGRVWDLRTGRSIMVLRSHIKPILALDWSPNGYQLATGGEDNTIRVWDIRAAKCFYTIPAHKSTITQIKYWRSTDAFESDKFKDWSIEKDEDGIMEVEDVSTTFSKQADVFTAGSHVRRCVLDGSSLLSSSYDGTCKLWSDADFKPLKSLSGLEGRIMCADISGDGQHIAASLYDRTFKIYGL